MFKVGALVRIKPYKEMTSEERMFMNSDGDMNKYCGKAAVIVKAVSADKTLHDNVYQVRFIDSHFQKLQESEMSWWWTESMFRDYTVPTITVSKTRGCSKENE